MPVKATGIDVAKAAIAAASNPDVRFSNQAAVIPRAKITRTNDLHVDENHRTLISFSHDRK